MHIGTTGFPAYGMKLFIIDKVFYFFEIVRGVNPDFEPLRNSFGIVVRTFHLPAKSKIGCNRSQVC